MTESTRERLLQTLKKEYGIESWEQLLSAMENTPHLDIAQFVTKPKKATEKTANIT